MAQALAIVAGGCSPPIMIVASLTRQRHGHLGYPRKLLGLPLILRDTIAAKRMTPRITFRRLTSNHLLLSRRSLFGSLIDGLSSSRDVLPGSSSGMASAQKRRGG